MEKKSMGKNGKAGKAGKLTMKKFEGTPLDKKVDMAAIKKVNSQKGDGKKKK